jgi:acetolactate synthase small subunit
VEDVKQKKYCNVIAEVVDRAGALTSVASAFSNRSITVDTILAHGTDAPEDSNGRIVVLFWASDEEKEMMLRILQRLSKVVRVSCLPGSLEHHRQVLRSIMDSLVSQSL